MKRNVVLVIVILWLTASLITLLYLLVSTEKRMGDASVLAETVKVQLNEELQRYKVRDSLSAVRIHAVEMSLTDYKERHAKDLSIIKDSKAKLSELENALTAYTSTDVSVDMRAEDSIVIDTLKCFSKSTEWYSLQGCVNLNNDTVSAHLTTHDVLHISETVTYKRFLGCLWKTRRVKSRKVDVVCENPNTVIIDFDFVHISE